LAIILVGGITQWLMLALSIGAYLAIGWMHVQGSLPQPQSPEADYMLFAMPVGGILIFITMLQWFYTRQFRQAMAEARRYANELAAHQATLEQTVTERTAELNRLLNSMSDAVVATTPDGIIRSWNPAAQRIFGWTAEEAQGESVVILFPTEETFLTLRDEVVQLAMAGTPQQTEVVAIRKDKAERVVRISFSAIFDEQNNPTGIVTLVADITEQKEMEAEQERLQKEVITAQQQVIQDLSTPVIPVMQGIIVMPLVGNIDSMRAQDVTRSLLAGITQHRARIVIIDVTGVSLMDTGIINRLNKTIQAAQLKGAQTIITGISDAVAESIVDLGIDWSGITTLSNLQMGLVKALNNIGVKLEGNSR
jgi:rsbT co-antagonist protein RsbR